MQHINTLTSNELEELLGRQKETTKFTVIVTTPNGATEKKIMKNEKESFKFIEENKDATFRMEHASESL